MRATLPLLLLTLLLTACVATTNKDRARLHPDEPTTTVQTQTGTPSAAPSPMVAPGAMSKPVPKQDPTPVPTQAMSPSTVCALQGSPQGTVLLYPRLIPRKASAEVEQLADQLQIRVGQTLGLATPNRPVDVCPKPGRSCPQGGCQGLGVGVLLLHQGSACAAVALISTPGRSDTELVPWAGKVELKDNTVAFREPPESLVTIDDFVPCDELLQDLKAGEAGVIKVIQQTAKQIDGPK